MAIQSHLMVEVNPTIFYTNYYASLVNPIYTENIEKDPPWAMVFADDLVLCAMTREEGEEDLETWRVVFERHGLKISRTKTEYLPSPTNDTETTVKIVDAELPTVTSFKYLGSLSTSEEGSQADVNNRIRIGWMKWKEVSGVMCDRKMPVKLKDKVFKTIIRPAMTCIYTVQNVVWPLLEARTQPHLCEIAKTRGFWEKEQRPTEKEIQRDMKKYQLTEDMAQDRKYWMTKILTGPAQGDGQER